MGRRRAVEVPRGRLGRSWAEPHVGAVATQSYANPAYGPDGLALMRDGRSAQEAVDASWPRTTGAPSARSGSWTRAGADFTGDECHDWAGGRTGAAYAAQGNILVSARQSTRSRRRSRLRPASLRDRLLACLAAAQDAGGDRRGQQSAALLVVEREAATSTPTR